MVLIMHRTLTVVILKRFPNENKKINVSYSKIW